MTNESKWASEFGTEYTQRNNPDIEARRKIFRELLSDFYCFDFLEVGCNKGHNLEALYIQDLVTDLVGVDVSEEALKQAKAGLVLKSSAYNLPFLDNYFELVFTAGVLIHLDDYLKAMKEIYRVSSKYILTIEYFDKEPRKIEYRDGVLCQAMPWRDIWFDNFSNLKVVKEGKMSDLGFSDGTDFSQRCDYLLMEKL